MKFDFSCCVNPKVEDVYPPLFLDAYADLKDILSINDMQDLYDFIYADRCEAMIEDVLHMLPPMDWAMQERMDSYVTNIMEEASILYEDMFQKECDKISEDGVDIDEADAYVLVRNVQLHMGWVAAWIAEAILSTQDKKIEFGPKL